MVAVYDWIKTNPMVFSNLATALAGYIAAMFVGYFKLTQDLSFIKGQLSSILDLHAGMKDLASKHATMERDLIQNIRDIEKAFARLKVIESKHFKSKETLS